MIEETVGVEEEEVKQEQPVYTPVINQIAMYYNGNRKLEFSDNVSNETKGQELEALLTEVCELIATAGDLTNKAVDLDFCLGLVGAYLISKQADGPEPEVAPAELFAENIFAQLEKQKEEAGDE